jgi:hypothetical protein
LRIGPGTIDPLAHLTSSASDAPLSRRSVLRSEPLLGSQNRMRFSVPGARFCATSFDVSSPPRITALLAFTS